MYVSSRGILASCDIKSDTPESSVQTLNGYDFSKLKDGCTVYICTSAMNDFSQILPSLPYIILVTGDSDLSVSEVEEYENILDSSNIIHWYAQNCDVEHPKLTAIPIGLDYHTDDDTMDNIELTPFWDRKLIGYSNFHFPSWYWEFKPERSEAVVQIPKESVYYEPIRVSRRTTWENQSKYAFVYSPTGHGYDCHRTWEALCLGCIPIIRRSPITSLFDDLPVLIVDSWSDVTLQLLKDTVNKFKQLEFNYEKLKLSYWLDLINSKKFQGVTYRTAENWFNFIAVEDRPINYLEIGVFYGANIISVANSYGKHPDSKLHCIDPWVDYDGYPEYKGQQQEIYNKFLHNIAHYNNITVHRGFSHEKLITLPNDYFDIIYIDGNHSPEYVLEDAVLSFRKLAIGGVMIFDDYGWDGAETQLGIDAFWSAYKTRLEYVGFHNTQLFIRKII